MKTSNEDLVQLDSSDVKTPVLFLLFLLLQPKKKKNISHDVFGTSFGRVHMQKQDLSKLKTRKMKGLRKRKGEVVNEDQEPKVAKVES